MKNIIIIYETDPLLDENARTCIGLATTSKKRDSLIREYLRYYIEVKDTSLIKKAIEEIQQSGKTDCLLREYRIGILTITVPLNKIIYD